MHDYSQKADCVDRLVHAIEDCRVVSLRYRSLRSAQAATYQVRPYGLVYHRGALYLVGWSARREAIRHWKVDRIEAVELTPLRFARPEDFNLQEHLQHCFGVFHGEGSVQVRVRFSRAVARYVQESVWHASQRLTLEEEGSVLAEFCLSNTEEAKRWLLGFGRHAVVLEPAHLREELIAEA